MKFIFTHRNSDFDAVASLLGAHKLYPEAEPVLPHRINRNVREFVALYQNILPFVQEKQVKGADITGMILVDTQTLPQMHGLKSDVPVIIIDHHPQDEDFDARVQAFIDEVGSTSTLLVERIQKNGIVITPLEATLLALGIYEDTGSLTYGTTTARDIRAAAWLLEHHAALDTIRRFLAPPLTTEQQTAYETLMEGTESRVLNGHTIIVCAAEIDEHVPQLNSVAHRLRDTLDPAALFVVVKMPSYIQLICRATEDAIDVGEIAREFGGGGHARAASAPIKDEDDLQKILDRLWGMLPAHVKPMTTVAELMSQGVKTVGANQRIEYVIRELRRVGHEGYPVIDDGKVVGLLKLRDADRAMEHDLDRSRVHEIMEAGTYTLTPDDSVSRLEHLIVESGWGQIPVVSQKGELLGIVTRTDLINHWVQAHPAEVSRQARIEPERIVQVLGKESAALIRLIADFAQRFNIHLYLVGGIVRDLLLDRPNFDIDFVVETNGHFTGNAIDFAEKLQDEFGGRVSSYQPFATAKWRLDETVAEKLNTSLDVLPVSVDFATSRNEFYERPTALPTVYAGSIKLDLHRRDFTINTLAIQMSPHTVEGRILDFYGGLNDLRMGVIRVLHSLSFIDDPTRVIRAVRFKHRLNFKIDPRTAQLIESSHPVLQRITGERIRNELSLLFREQQPENALIDLQERGVLSAIHAAFTIDDRIRGYFEQARKLNGEWYGESFDLTDVYWHLLFAYVPPQAIDSLCERLLLGKPTATEIKNIAQLLRSCASWTGVTPPSQITFELNEYSAITLITTWIVSDEKCRALLEKYQQIWQHIRANTTGHDLRKLGLKAGPQYRIILQRLNAAWLDGQITDEDGEQALLQILLKDGEFES